jgi:tetratricopeptide (TPR) repeat protein
MKHAIKTLLLVLISSISFAQISVTHQKAITQINNGNYKKAEKFATKAYKADNNNDDLAILLALAKLGQGKVDQCNLTLDLAIIKDPKNTKLLSKRGEVALALNDFKTASDFYSKALKYETSDSLRCLYYTQRGACKLSLRKMDGAYKDLLKALALDSMNFAANNDMGIVAKYVGKDSMAEQSLKNVIEILPDNHIGYANLGWFYQERKRYDEALDLLNRAIEIAPDFAYAYNNRSMVKLDMEDIEGAFTDVFTSLKLDDSNSYAYKNLGIIYFKDGKKEEACAAWNKALLLGFTEKYGRTVNELIKHNCN